MNPEPQTILLWANLFLSLAAVAGHVKNWMSSGDKALTKDVAVANEKASANERKLIEHDRRIQHIESDIKHLPDRDTAHKLALAMADISARLNTLEVQIEGQLIAMDERLKPIAATSIRLQEFLIDQAAKN